MEYLKKENDYMIKYNVKYEKNYLWQIMRQIVKRCGLRVHKSVDTDYPKYDDLFYENYIRTPIGEKEYFEETRIIYHVEYDLIIEPILAKMIREFINNDDITLLHYIYESELYPLDCDIDKKEKIEQQLVDIISENEIDYNKLRNLLDDENIDIIKSVNATIESQEEYIDTLKKCIHLVPIAKVNYDEYDRVMKFIRKKNQD